MSEWQPIETAPVAEHIDGVLTPLHVIVFHPKANPNVYLRLADGNWWRNNPEIAPTHWMPLPAPPETP